MQRTESKQKGSAAGKKKGGKEKRVKVSARSDGSRASSDGRQLVRSVTLTRSQLNQKQLMGASGSATMAFSKKAGVEVVALHAALTGTIHAWEISLMETLINPMTPYPLPGITTTGHWGYNPASHQNGYTPGGPNFFPNFLGDFAFQDQSGITQEIGNYPVSAMQMDTYAGARYDQREGLVRGTFSIETSGTYLIWFDPTDINNPVVARSLGNSETWWTDATNTAPIFAGAQTQIIFDWDRDPYRNYANNFRPLADYGDVSTNQFTYVGGAVLHLAVQAKTAYSDVAIKARNIANYDRRFFDAPTSTGEYGDPSQPEKANEAAALYNGTTWGPVFSLLSSDEKASASRLHYIIQRGFPLLEVHVVNAATGGAPVNFNFEARTWLGVSYTTLKDNATTMFHTVPCEIPPWYAACKMRGAVTMHRTELGEALIQNTMRTMRTAPMSPIVKAITDKVAPKKAGGNFFSKMLTGLGDALGIDRSNPIPGIASLVTGKILPAISSLL